MNELKAGMLWIGNAIDARNPRKLLDAGIGAVVDLAYEESPAQLPRQMTYCRFPLNDGGGNDPRLVIQALQTTLRLLQNKIPTLIACSAGMSRSPTMAAFAMAGFASEDPEKCLLEIGKIRSLELKSQLWGEVLEAYRASQVEMDT